MLLFLGNSSLPLHTSESNKFIFIVKKNCGRTTWHYEWSITVLKKQCTLTNINFIKTVILPDGGEKRVLQHVGTIQEEKDTSDHNLQRENKNSLNMGFKLSHWWKRCDVHVCAVKHQTYSLPAVVLPAAIHALQEGEVVQRLCELHVKENIFYSRISSKQNVD